MRAAGWLPFDWRRPLVYTHRWLGIAGGVFFIAWFISGLVMMYAGMPDLTAEERLARLPALDLSTARVAPAEAARGAGVAPERLRVGMLAARPVYRFSQRGRWTTVFADDASRLGGLTADKAASLVRLLAPEYASTVRYDGYLTDSDQWTLEIRGLMPMHRIALGDPEDSYFYVSDRTGDVVMKTTRRGRRWAYAGPVLHWIYFTPFRRQAAVWAQSIIWGSVAGCLLCLSGIVWGVWRYSPTSRYRIKRVRSHSPYAALMRWHHYAGLIFGLATFTWILSGLLSMDPWAWHPGTSPTRQQREAVAGGPLRLDVLTLGRMREGVAAAGSSSAPKEIDVVQFRGEPFLAARGASSPLDRRLVSALAPERGTFTRFDSDAVGAAARAAMPGTAVEEEVWLQAYDAYYYDRHGRRPLPVLRVRYSDPQRTWLYLDPRSGAIVQKEERLTRLNRWLYHGLHSLDFPFLYYRRPLWDIVVILLSLGGVVLSVSTLMPAWHRLRRQARVRRLALSGG